MNFLYEVIRVEVSNIEKFKIISKQWANIKDVMALSGFKRTKSHEILKEIQTQIAREGKKNIARGIIPMKRLLDYLGIDKEEIFQAAKQEKELFGLGE